MGKPIAVLGGGNGGHTMAADLTLAGHEVHFYEHPSFAASFAPVMKRGSVELQGIGRRGVARIKLITTNIEKALKSVELINLVIPAFGHELFFHQMLPYLRDGQTVVVWAGDFSSLRLANLMKEKGIDKKVTVVETHTLPYGTRLREPGVVDCLLLAPRVLFSALPSVHNQPLLEPLRQLFPAMEAGRNVLMVALSNPNPIVHPPGSVLSTARIEYTGGDFYMYREGITAAVARVIRQLHEETAALGRALGFEVLQYEERDFRTTASIMGMAFQAPFDTLGVIAGIKGPKSLNDRYLKEDLPFGLVPMSELGKKLGVLTPIIDAIIGLGSIICEEDFWNTGRKLKDLGLAEMSKEEIVRYIEQ